MERHARGVVLVAGSLLLLGLTLGAGAATAPDRSVAATGGAETLVGSQGGGFGWHERGSVYLVENGTIAWREDSADSYFDVTVLPDGTVLAGFMQWGYDTGCEPYWPPCTKTGFRIIDPDAAGGPAVVGEYAFPVRTGENSEAHDVERLASGEYLLSDMEHERVFTVRGVESGDPEITWQWNASSFYDAPPDPTRRDWLHINDVDAVNETHYLVSVRNANQILLVERGAGVVEVVNADRGGNDGACQDRGEQLADFDGDGDIRCGNPEILDHQHNPQWLGDGAVLVADSDNHRVVELHRTDDGRWEPSWVLTRAGGIDLYWPRDADRLDNGNTLVTDTLNERIFEVTPGGAVVWSTGTPTDSPIPYEAERLPEGERVGGVQYGTDAGDIDNLTSTLDPAVGGVPGLSLALVGLRAVAPWTPFWFGELHLALSVLSLLGVVAGAVVWYRG